MRKILFRGKRVDTEEWVEGDYIASEFISPHKNGELYVNKSYTDGMEWGEGCFYRVIPETVGQYTGLKDKNGTKMFEGDILHFKAYQGGGFGCPIGTDIYNEIIYTKHNIGCNVCSEYIGYMAQSKKGCLSSISYLIDSHYAKVIGNIHDNPELMEANNDR